MKLYAWIPGTAMLWQTAPLLQRVPPGVKLVPVRAFARFRAHEHPMRKFMSSKQSDTAKGHERPGLLTQIVHSLLLRRVQDAGEFCLHILLLFLSLFMNSSQFNDNT